MSDPRRRLPGIDALLTEPAIAALLAAHPRSLVLRAARDAVEAARSNGGSPPAEGWPTAIAGRVARYARPSLVPVINATGVVLHTNLGRAPLAPAALEALQRAGAGYTTLEYDLARGERGSRHRLCRDLLVELTGAEDAMVVNNAAAALLLALSALARGGAAIVSRGELVEIGGQFRIPDVLARSGATLVEVGTTNRTHREDYVKAIGPDTRLLLKVHRSNFQITGFTTEVAASEIAEIARERGLTTLYDLGSGLMIDLSRWGLAGEPSVPAALTTGVDAVVFSGDKLLGGPQAGILLGTKAVVVACRSDPVARAVRADKFTLAALEATLALYRDPEVARREIPTLQMLTASPEDLKRRGQTLARALPDAARAEVREGASEVGGGSFPGAVLPTWLVRLDVEHPTANLVAERLRSADPPVIARIERDRVVLDPRTVVVSDEGALVRAVTAALDG